MGKSQAPKLPICFPGLIRRPINQQQVKLINRIPISIHHQIGLLEKLDQ